jgi:hypothetical protein
MASTSLRVALASLVLGLGACASVGDVKDATLDWVDERAGANIERPQDFAERAAQESATPRAFIFDPVKVKPWERDVLARPDMAWETDAHRAAHRSHIFFSKEGSLIGGSAGGGGCGCN